MKTILTTRAYCCGELGACQSRTPPCKGCDRAVVHAYPQPRKPHTAFAPGVIDYGRRRTSHAWWVARRGDAAWRFLKRLCLAGLSMIALAFVLGVAMGLGNRFMAWIGY